MNKFKKMAGAALAAAVLLFAGVGQSHAAEAANVAPSYANGIRHQDQSYMGMKVKALVASTAKTTLVATGEGVPRRDLPVRRNARGVLDGVRHRQQRGRGPHH